MESLPLLENSQSHTQSKSDTGQESLKDPPAKPPGTSLILGRSRLQSVCQYRTQSHNSQSPRATISWLLLIFMQTPLTSGSSAAHALDSAPCALLSGFSTLTFFPRPQHSLLASDIHVLSLYSTWMALIRTMCTLVASPSAWVILEDFSCVFLLASAVSAVS